jgi:hypothetical protein
LKETKTLQKSDGEIFNGVKEKGRRKWRDGIYREGSYFLGYEYK